jgi:hypothetical protein
LSSQLGLDGEKEKKKQVQTARRYLSCPIGVNAPGQLI